MDSVFETYLGPDGMLAGVAGAVSEPDDIPKTNSTVWVLGKRYNAIHELALIRSDIQSRLWCTYRRGFVPLGEPQLTTDKGWGCMLRCGQMVLAQALIDLHLGRDWFWTPETRDSTYLKIVNRFEDSRKSYFSIHQIALMGDSEDKKVGQWFGPNTVAQVIKKLVRYDDWCSIVVHVAMDNIIVTDDIYSLCLENPKNDETWKPLLLVIPLRLGLSDINPIYIPALKRCFELVGSCGMIGGRPNQALYFLGYVDDEVLYLDPHTTQRSGSVGQKTSQDEYDFDDTFHQKYAGRINFQQMDPSLAVCFLCKSRISFEILLEKLKNEVLSACTQPLFGITKTRSPEWVSMTGIESQFLTTTSRNNITTHTTTPTSIDATNRNTTSTPTTEAIANILCKRTISCCDSEDFENVNHIHTTGLSGNCCDADAESDEDFEIIS
ncbi:cysteine protease ATG4B isoform X2 [Teleopsis dalmanni]|uniref:cysteine protease ATG4B isoform X2 n=1 Tax=Teleopsis dalmanni TaxID=139649 RepID=UPI0018CF3ED2|nr:cysteine protease ATG4B isoform X2 [Teleopsis dalmanni]